ncbi:MAG: Gfo/Idh/MocA family oxidoreductase [Alphaproteobacteria bacterium]
MTNLIKVAVIGCGSMGKNHIKTYKNLNGVELVGIYDINQEYAQQVASDFGIKAFSSLEETAQNVEAVSVVTSSTTHGSVGEFFLSRGIHCLMEKPLATTPAECQMLINAAKSSGATLLVGHIEQFNPAVEQLVKILSDSSKVCSLTASRMGYVNRILDVDAAMDVMIHDVQIIQSIVKSPVSKVFASSVKNKVNPGGTEYITTILEFENGATANLTSSRMTQARVRTLTVTTDTNYIDMDFINQSINVHSQGRPSYVNQEEIPEWANYGLKGSVEQLFIPSNQPLQAELSHFVNCVNGKETPRISGQSAYDALKVIWEVQNQLGFIKDSSEEFYKIAAE